MKIAPRFLHKHTVFADSSAEKEALLVSIRSAPGVILMGQIDRHHKGGHRASLEVDQASLDVFIGHMDAQGWIDGF